MSSGNTATIHGMRLIARAVAAGFLAIDAAGSANLPGHGAVILAARHYHHLFDGVALLATVPRPIHILVALDWARGRCTRRVMGALTRRAQWPVILRPDGVATESPAVFTLPEIQRARRTGLAASVRLLGQGHALVVFPEGYPNIDPHSGTKKQGNEMLPFKAGFTAIAAAAERRTGKSVPIVPVGLHYRRDGGWRVSVRFGAPVLRHQFSCRGDMVEHVRREVEMLSR